jgi:ATP-dependent helicase/nuclease subunit A
MADARACVAPHAAALADWLAEGGKTDHKRSAALVDWLALIGQTPAPEEAAQWAKLEAIFLTKEGAVPKSLSSKKISEAVPQNAALMVELGEAMAQIVSRLRARSTYDLTAALLDFAAALTHDYAAAKAARAVLDYDDLIATTNALLSGHRAAQWVLFKIDSGLEHILVDEAQDTSPAQWRLIRALADEFFTGQDGHDTVRTLFAVGDEKQSIFSFQGADPREFDKQRHHFSEAVAAVGGRFHYVPLTLSWRSVPDVLALVDSVFSADAARAGVSLEPVRHEAHRVGAPGYVELWPVERAPESGPQIDLWALPEATAQGDAAGRLAARIGDKIEALLADAQQNVTAGDILILVRKRDAFVDEMIRALKRRRINVAGADRMVLLDQIVIMDILAAADFALNCDDDLTLACVLRSPLCGLDETQLFDLAHGRSATLWQAFEAQAARAKTDAVFTKAHQRLSWMRRMIDYLSPFDWLSQLLAAQGGHGALRAQLGAEIDDPVGELLRLALAYEARHVASMQGFLHWLRHGQQEIKRDMEGRGGAVRIMTVHGAKGLEAPIVFLPDTCRPPVKSGGGAEALQFDADGLPLWRASKNLREAYGAAQVEAAAVSAAEEEKRLLYVALTRARDRLYIGGYLSRKSAKLPVNCWYDRLAAAFDAPSEMTEPAIWGEGRETALEKAEADEGEQSAPSLSGETRPSAEIGDELPTWLRMTPPTDTAPVYYGAKLFSPSGLLDVVAPDTPIAGVAEADATNPALEAAALEAASRRGRWAHKLLESLPLLDAAKRRDAALAFLARQPDALADDAAAQLVDEVLQIIAAPAMAALFGPAGRAEVAIAGLLDMDDGTKLALSGQIDRYAETDDEIILVDFKTGHHPSDTPPAYMAQMAAYRALMQAATKSDGREKPVRCALVWTRTGAVDWLDDAQLDAYMADILSGRRKPV